MTGVLPFVVLIVLLAVNGYFVALEFALVGAQRSRLEPLAEAGNRSARRSLAAMRELSSNLAGAQLGITIASLLLGLFGEPAVAHLIEGGLDHVPLLPQGWIHPIALVVGLFIVVFAHMVFGEMVPKNLTLTHPETVLRALVGLNRVYLLFAGPFVRLLNALGNLGVRMLGVEPKSELASARTAEELAVVVAASREEGAIPGFAADLLSGVLEFGGRPVWEIMTPRDAIGAVSVSAPVSVIEEMAVQRGHSRLPLHGAAGLDDIVGFVHTKDLLTLDPSTLDSPLPTAFIRPMPVFPQERHLEHVLLEMRLSGTHLARLVDDEGRTVGLVTLDDLLEELVGDITDGSDL